MIQLHQNVMSKLNVHSTKLLQCLGTSSPKPGFLIFQYLTEAEDFIPHKTIYSVTCIYNKHDHKRAPNDVGDDPYDCN